jgi:hypothetical protein
MGGGFAATLAVGFALPMPAASAADSPLPEPVVVLGPASAPISNVFTAGDETPTDKTLDTIVPAETGEHIGDVLDVMETATGHGDSGDGSDGSGSRTVPIPATPRG